MIIKHIPLDSEKSDVYLDAYLADPIGDFVRNAILVIPGGGYGNVCSDREGEPIAQAFIPYGYNAFVLHYSVARSKKFPAQLIEASLAIKHIRDNAEEYNIDPEKVFVTGFSAGGHLTGSIGILWNKPEVYEAIDMPYGYNKPNGVMMIYPVVSCEEEYWHRGSFENLLCSDEPSAEELKEVSLEKNVTGDASPLFVMHTSNDSLVDVRNALCLGAAYRENGLEFEMHIYPDAPHGVALGNKITDMGCIEHRNSEIAKWVEQAARWAESVILKQNKAK